MKQSKTQTFTEHLPYIVIGIGIGLAIVGILSIMYIL